MARVAMAVLQEAAGQQTRLASQVLVAAQTGKLTMGARLLMLRVWKGSAQTSPWQLWLLEVMSVWLAHCRMRKAAAQQRRAQA